MTAATENAVEYSGLKPGKAVDAMLDFLRDERALRKHVRDAAIAMQLPEPSRQEWLDMCERVAAARDRLLAAVD